MARLSRYTHEADPALPYAVYAVNMATRLSTIGFLLLLLPGICRHLLSSYPHNHFVRMSGVISSSFLRKRR